MSYERIILSRTRSRRSRRTISCIVIAGIFSNEPLVFVSNITALPPFTHCNSLLAWFHFILLLFSLSVINPLILYSHNLKIIIRWNLELNFEFQVRSNACWWGIKPRYWLLKCLIYIRSSCFSNLNTLTIFHKVSYVGVPSESYLHGNLVKYSHQLPIVTFYWDIPTFSQLSLCI